ncbi:MAG: DUF1647 domain-containing protein [Lachnospiraceae bacterium]|nr:DUF1647 domain-containing protein [Lachnospiraceae bacterium]
MITEIPFPCRLLGTLETLKSIQNRSFFVPLIQISRHTNIVFCLTTASSPHQDQMMELIKTMEQKAVSHQFIGLPVQQHKITGTDRQKFSLV